MIDIFERSAAVVDELAELDPMTATAIGVPGHDDRWTDLSPAGVSARRSYWQGVLDEVAAFEPADHRSEVAARVLASEAERIIGSIDAGLHLVDLNNLASPWQSFRVIFEIAPTETASNWADIAARLETIDVALDGYLASLDAGRSAQRQAARRQVEAVIAEGRVAQGANDANTSSFDTLLEAYDSAGIDDDGLRARLAEATDHAKAAYGRATDWLETAYLPSAPVTDGVGRERYVQAAEEFLGETIDPDEVYVWGWHEVHRLQDELAGVCARIDSSASVAEVMHRLATDPGHGVESVNEFIAIMTARQEQALADLDGTHFDVDPRIRTIEVKTAPSGGATAPYYTGPSEDFSRPGRVWYPVDGRTFFPLFGEISTAYHEGFPGHHLQVGLQTAMGDQLSRFHRMMVWYSGSGEGWALYAEQLMGELGYFETPEYEVGLLTSQIFRASRIVIDIGCHLDLPIPDHASFHPGESWSFDLATEMLRDVAFLPPADADSEVTRYLGWPGQAISYKLGEKAILDLRAAKQAEPDFDLKAFHAEVLAVGSIGLDLMRELLA